MKRSLLKSLSMRSFAILIAVGGALGTPAGHVAALPDTRADARQTLLATAQNGQVLLAIDIDNGTSTVIGNTGVPPASLALAISPDKTTAYTIATTQDPSAAHLAKIDLATGAETLVGQPIGQNLYIMGMIFSRDGTLYAAGDYDPESPTFNSLYTVDLATGLANRVGPLGGARKSDFIMSFTFSPSGELYGASMMSLYSIDPATATAAKIADFEGAAADPPQIMGIAFDENGGLYGADHVDLPDGGSTIYSVDPQTAELTPLFNTGIAFVHNIGFISSSNRTRIQALIGNS